MSIQSLFANPQGSGSASAARLPGLDGMRAIAVMLVIFDHLCRSRLLPLPQTAFDIGNLGVRIFFVVSGFIITKLLLDERRKASNRNNLVEGVLHSTLLSHCAASLAFYLVVTVGARVLMGHPPALRDLWIIGSFMGDYFEVSMTDAGHLGPTQQ